MYFAAAGPWVASLPSARKKVFQPFSASVGLVAEGVIVARPASSNSGSAALDSPEKAGPTMPTMVLSSMAFFARPGALRRVTLGVEVRERDLAVRVLLVVLVDGQLDAVLDVDAEVGVVAGQRAEEADLEVALRLLPPPDAVAAALGATAGQGQCSDHDRCAVLDERTHDSS